MLVADEGVEPSRPSNLEVSMLYKGIPHARAIGHRACLRQALC